MTMLKPLVIKSGLVQQLQSGDTVDVQQGINQTNANAGTITIGQPVYCSAAGSVDLAKADAAGTTKVLGLVRDTSILTSASGEIYTDGILTATTGQWDAVAGTTGGLTFNTYYYLSEATAGHITATAPSTTGKYVVRVGYALSTTELKIEIQPEILL